MVLSPCIYALQVDRCCSQPPLSVYRGENVREEREQSDIDDVDHIYDGHIDDI